MNNQEKFERSFIYQRSLGSKGKWPHQAEVYAQANELIPQLCKLPYDYMFGKDPVAMAEGMLLIWEYTGVDLLATFLDVYNFEAESIGAKLNFYQDHIPDIDRSDFLIKSEADFEKIKWNGADSGRFPYLIDFYKAVAKYTGYEAFPLFCAPWSLASNIYGLENLIVAAMTDAGFVHEMLRRIIDDLQAPMYRELNDILPGLQTADLVDAWCSPPMVTYELVSEFSLPYLERLTEKIGIDGVAAADGGLWGASLYTGEQREKYLEFMVNAGGNLSVAVFDPDAGNIGPRKLRRYADKRGLPLTLGYGSAKLQLQSVEEIVEDIKAYTLAGKDGSTPLVLFLNSIGPHTPLKNIHAAVASAKTYGAVDTDADTPFCIPIKESFEEFLKAKIADNKEGYTFQWLEKSGYSYLKGDTNS